MAPATKNKTYWNIKLSKLNIYIKKKHILYIKF